VRIIIHLGEIRSRSGSENRFIGFGRQAELRSSLTIKLFSAGAKKKPIIMTMTKTKSGR